MRPDGRGVEYRGLLERDVGLAVGGESTLHPAFVTGTGVTFTEWRSWARLQAALPLVERGLPVAAVATRVGCASVCGLGTAFRRRYGPTPGSWRHPI